MRARGVCTLSRAEDDLRAVAERLDEHVCALSGAASCITIDALDALVMMAKVTEAADLLRSSRRALGVIAMQGRRAHEGPGPVLVVDNCRPAAGAVR